MKSLKDTVLRIIEDEENMRYRHRRDYWADQIILAVRLDERARMKKAIHRTVRQQPNLFHFDDVAAFLSIVDDA